MGTARTADGADGHPVASEIRLAVAMNGGVSLAVWIGGVAYELAKASEKDPAGPWATVLGERPVIIDVLAGTSAGGINAAFLALNQSHGADLGPPGRCGWTPAALSPRPTQTVRSRTCCGHRRSRRRRCSTDRCSSSG